MSGSGRPYRIGYHVYPVNAQGQYLRDTGMFSDMDVYADTTPTDGSSEAQEVARATAFEVACELLANPRAVRVHIYESHQPQAGSSWQLGPHVATITRDDAGLPPVFLTAYTRCWDTTVLDRAERVHAMLSNGSCQCGDPTAGYGGQRS